MPPPRFLVARPPPHSTVPRMPRLWIALASIAAAGCGEEIDPRPASWGYIHPAIVVPNCATAGCHSEASAQAGLSFESEQDALRAFKAYTRPFNWNGSQLNAQLRGLPFLGSAIVRMPPDAPLPEADVQLIGRWVDQGAAP